MLTVNLIIITQEEATIEKTIKILPATLSIYAKDTYHNFYVEDRWYNCTISRVLVENTLKPRIQEDVVSVKQVVKIRAHELI